MAQDQNHLIWIDLEMTGLSPEINRIIEMAVVITDSQLNIIAQAPVWVIYQTDEHLASMDAWNTTTHGRSGLINKVKTSSLTEAAAAQQMLQFLQCYVPKNTSPMCGNSVCQDRRFLARWMPEVEAWFHYRNLDVSTLKELVRRWRPALAKGLSKHGKHEALADIHESIEELRYYREYFIRVEE
jgi:oligoribonuclease